MHQDKEDQTKRIICEDCGESPTLVSINGGVVFGVECSCERVDGTPIGTYVEPSSLFKQWSVDTKIDQGAEQ